MPYYTDRKHTHRHTRTHSLSTCKHTRETSELNDPFKKKFHNFLKVKMSTLKSLEFFNNPKITTKHQNTPNMLLLLLLSSASCYIYLRTHIRPGCKDRAGRVSGAYRSSTVLTLQAVQSESHRRRSTRLQAATKTQRFFTSLPSQGYSSGLFTSSSTAGALLSPEMSCGCRTRGTSMTELYMVVGGGGLLHAGEVRATGLSQ